MNLTTHPMAYEYLALKSIFVFDNVPDWGKDIDANIY
jgi:hypothetical protein